MGVTLVNIVKPDGTTLNASVGHEARATKPSPLYEWMRRRAQVDPEGTIYLATFADDYNKAFWVDTTIALYGAPWFKHIPEEEYIRLVNQYLQTQEGARQ